MRHQGRNFSFLETGRPVAEGRNGAISSPHYLATQSGKRILEKGGHATEAAITVNAVLSVVIPHMAGLGGDLFALIYDQEEKEVKSLHGSGRSGTNVSREQYKENNLDEIPERGPLAANTIPGTVDAWWELHQRYGKLNWEALFEDAIDYAINGFPITGNFAQFIQEERELLEESSAAKHIFFNLNKPLTSGEILIQSDLGWSFKQIAKHGKDAFYHGEIRDRIVSAMKNHGGLLVKDDFAQHEGEWEKPLKTNYRGHEVYQVKPNTQGIAVLMMLNMLEKNDIATIHDGTPDYYHLMAESAKFKFRLRDEWVTDLESIDFPYDELLSESFTNDVYENFSWNEAYPIDQLDDLPSVDPGRDTAYLSVVDKEGNAISLIQSIFHEFGSGFMPEGTGIFLQNRGSHFSLSANHPNSLEPNKRTFHTIIPGMALKNGKPTILFGSMGGEGQPQTQCAMLTRIIDFGYNMQQAIEAPRWLYGRTWGEDSSTIKLEGRIPTEVVNELKRRGHEIEIVEDYSPTMGHAQGILIDEDRGVYSAGADPRGDGLALSW